MPKAKYEEIYKDIKFGIESGKYKYGEQLPSENDFVQLYKCSRNTVRRSIAMLVSDGYVQAVHGKGVDVIYQPSSQTSFTVGGIESFKEVANRNHLTNNTEVTECKLITICDELAKKTGFEKGTKVHLVRRIRYLDKKPLIMDTTLFLADIIPKINKEIAENSVYDYLENELGVQITTSKRTITVERATELDKKFLSLGNYDCMAVITSQTFNKDGIMFEYTVSRHHPEYFSFQDIVTKRK